MENSFTKRVCSLTTCKTKWPVFRGSEGHYEQLEDYLACEKACKEKPNQQLERVKDALRVIERGNDQLYEAPRGYDGELTELAEHIGVSRATVYRWRSRQIPAPQHRLDLGSKQITINEAIIAQEGTQ